MIVIVHALFLQEANSGVSALYFLQEIMYR